MDNKLRSIFEYQRFSENSRLAKIISDTESKYSSAISDEYLDFVSAAGEFEIEQNKEEKF